MTLLRRLWRIRIHSGFIAAVLLLCCTTANAQWSQLGGTVKQVSAGASGALWAISVWPATDGLVMRWEGSNWRAKDAYGVKVVVDGGGIAWLLSSQGTISFHSAGRWLTVPGRARDIAVGADGSLWAIGTEPVGPADFSIHRFNGIGWDATNGGGTRVAVGPNGVPWVLNSRNEIWRRNGNSWTRVPGSAREISFAPNGSLWTISTVALGAAGNFLVQMLMDANGTTFVPPGSQSAALITVDRLSQPLVVDASGRMFTMATPPPTTRCPDVGVPRITFGDDIIALGQSPGRQIIRHVLQTARDVVQIIVDDAPGLTKNQILFQLDVYPGSVHSAKGFQVHEACYGSMLSTVGATTGAGRCSVPTEFNDFRSGCSVPGNLLLNKGRSHEFWLRAHDWAGAWHAMEGIDASFWEAFGGRSVRFLWLED